MSFESLFRTTTTLKVNPSDVVIPVAVLPTITSGRMRIYSAKQEELISFTWISAAAWSPGNLTWVTRGLSRTAVPATGWTWLTWVAWSQLEDVLMHDQIIDRASPEALTFATTAARDSALWGNGVATKAYTGVYVIATGLFYNYNLSTNQWESVSTGTTTPNSSTTVAGKVETATTAESKAATDVGWTGANLMVLPSDIAKNTQSSTFVYWTDSGGDDTYVVALTPVLAAYTEWQELVMKVTTPNTWACTVDFGPWAKSIVMPDGSDPVTGSIQGIVPLRYNGTNFVVQGGITLNTLTANTVEVETYATHEVPLVATSASAMAGWTSVALTVAQSAAWYSALSGSSAKWYATSAVWGSGSTDGYATSAGKTIRIKWRMRFPSLGADNAAWGLTTTAASMPEWENDVVNAVRFVNDGGVLWAHNANGATATKTNVTGGLTLSNYNTYMIVFTPGSQALFYVNGTLVSTSTTNLPTWTLVLGLGVLTNSKAINCFPPIVSTQL